MERGLLHALKDPDTAWRDEGLRKVCIYKSDGPDLSINLPDNVDPPESHCVSLHDLIVTAAIHDAFETVEPRVWKLAGRYADRPIADYMRRLGFLRKGPTLSACSSGPRVNQAGKQVRAGIGRSQTRQAGVSIPAAAWRNRANCASYRGNVGGRSPEIRSRMRTTWRL